MFEALSSFQFYGKDSRTKAKTLLWHKLLLKHFIEYFVEGKVMLWIDLVGFLCNLCGKHILLLRNDIKLLKAKVCNKNAFESIVRHKCEHKHACVFAKAFPTRPNETNIDICINATFASNYLARELEIIDIATCQVFGTFLLFFVPLLLRIRFAHVHFKEQNLIVNVKGKLFNISNRNDIVSTVLLTMAKTC